MYPAYQDARAEGAVIGAKGCEECQKTVDRQTRQANGCGWEPRTASAVPWLPQAWLTRNLATTVCPGYTTSLPGVEEIVEVYAHWEHGTLTEYLDGEPPTPVALYLLSRLKAGILEHDAEVLRRKREAS